MCFGGSKNNTPAQPAPPKPGIVDVANVAPDPSRAAEFRGRQAAPNETGRMGGGLLLDAAAKQNKTTLGA